jgi:hypothetical protein
MKKKKGSSLRMTLVEKEDTLLRGWSKYYFKRMANKGKIKCHERLSGMLKY